MIYYNFPALVIEWNRNIRSNADREQGNLKFTARQKNICLSFSLSTFYFLHKKGMP